MRQLFLFIAFILFQGYSFGQDLEKIGNLLPLKIQTIMHCLK